ncbi:MAG: hypothetical protein GF308_18655 [Candidatus Heimdallarchaeota archaeon]|nr:hypothetical protein [Candidatus Heimdallarchaeota archaeon]
MSKNIDTVKVQIPGTMYYLELADDRGRWVLSLKLRSEVEKSVVVPVLSKNGVDKATKEVLNDSRLELDKYPLGKVCDQLYEAARANFPEVQTSDKKPEAIASPEFDEIKQKVDIIETTLENVVEELKENIENITESLTALETDRVARLENELTKRAEEKDFEERFESLLNRLNKLEEAIASSDGDERVPSILTAIEALESKISQLEGTALTREEKEEGEEKESGDTDLPTIKGEVAKISKAFDMINERLTNLENRLNKLEEDEEAPIEQ